GVAGPRSSSRGSWGRRGTVHADIVDLEPRREPRPGRITAVPPADGEAEEEVVRLAQRVGRAAGAVESRVKGRGVEEQGIDVQPDLALVPVHPPHAIVVRPRGVT